MCLIWSLDNELIFIIFDISVLVIFHLDLASDHMRVDIEIFAVDSQAEVTNSDLIHYSLVS